MKDGTDQNTVLARITILCRCERRSSSRICLIWKSSDVTCIVGVRPLQNAIR